MKWVIRIIGILIGLAAILGGLCTYSVSSTYGGGGIEEGVGILILIAGVILIIVVLLPWKRILNL
jgi:hypothetical protein